MNTLRLVLTLVLCSALLAGLAGCTGKAATTTASNAIRTTTTVAPGPSVWTDLNPAGSFPLARADHSMVYDPATGKVILVGGRNGAASVSDLWVYDPTANTWTNLNLTTSDHPFTIGFPSMAYDASAHKAIFFGSAGSGMVRNDTWAYDPSANTWTRLNPAGDVPSARVGQQLVYDPGTGKVILFGGTVDETDFDETWAYDYAANTWTELHPASDVPPGRFSHSMVYDSASGTVVLFGGLGGGGTCLNDTWAYDPVANTWTELYPAGDKPSARSGHSMVYDSGVGKVVLFGGLEADGTYLSDTWGYGVEP